MKKEGFIKYPTIIKTIKKTNLYQEQQVKLIKIF